MNFYDRVRGLARIKGYSISALEREMGWSQGYISKQKDIKEPTARTYQLARFLNVTEDYLINGADTPRYYDNEEASNLAQHLLDRPDHQVLFDAIKSVKPEDVEFVKQFIERVCDDKH